MKCLLEIYLHNDINIGLILFLIKQTQNHYDVPQNLGQIMSWYVFVMIQIMHISCQDSLNKLSPKRNYIYKVTA